MSAAEAKLDHSTQEIMTQDKAQPMAAPAPTTPMEMIAQALTNNSDVGLIDKLMTLQERWETNQGRKAFDLAISAAKSEIPVIAKNKKGHNSSYADFAAIAKAVDPILANHGLSYRFRTHQENNEIKVTCVLSHSDGHAEETTLQANADTSGNKNSIQAIGSTLTYLQRYTLVQMLGLASSEDDDGQAADQSKMITDDEREQIANLIAETGTDIQRICQAYSVGSIAELSKANFDHAMRLLKQKKAKQNANS